MESCVIQVTAAARRHGNLNIAPCGRGFFPEDTIGGSTRAESGTPVTIMAEGMPIPVKTDIPRERKTGKPRWLFRDRAWVKDFVRSHSLAPGDLLRLERVAERVYRLRIQDRSPRRLQPTFLEFFAGIGLVRLGLEKGGWQLLYANDIDPQKREMYEAHFGDADAHFELGDIHKVDTFGIPSATLATASFPCTDLSLAGGRKGLNGGQSSSFFGFIRVLKEMERRRPPLVLLENVTAFLTSHRGNDFRQAMLELNELGYSVDPFILDAKWFVPQSRARLFVAASMLAQEGDNGDAAQAAPCRTRPPAIVEFIASHPEIRWSLREIPPPPLCSRLSLPAILDDLDDDAPEWWSKERKEYLFNQMSARHQAVAKAWMAQEDWCYGTIFRRVRRQPAGQKRSMAELRSDGLAGCLRTPKGGSGRQILFKAGFGTYAARLLTPRECARLMGADDFTIKADLNQALFGFGDAVCVPAITWIAKNYLDPLVAATNQSGMLRDREYGKCRCANKKELSLLV